MPVAASQELCLLSRVVSGSGLPPGASSVYQLIATTTLLATGGFPADPDRDFIKRIIALPGQTVEVRDLQVIVDGVALEESYLLDPPAYRFGPETVPAGHVFVLGDARNNYNDARAWCVRDIQNKAKNVVWLNPESPSAWGFGDSVMDRYLPYCDVVEECRNLRQLSKVVDQIVL